MLRVKKILLLLVLNSFFCAISNGQQLVEGDTHALIIGVSAYESPGIPSLDFAHKDAEVFRDYLKSPAGGSVPNENIKLLTNNNATIGGINGGIDWLRDNVGEKDLVYIYFSGHGDVSDGIHNVGYLLGHDSPDRNFPMNSVRIDAINFFANNLSVKLGARVIIILDACHAGKVSGSENVRSLSLGESLVSKIKENEIRISSCRPTERSQEDVAWGNGRGAFSFYLIKGLEGLADNDGDNIVTLGELDKYLSKVVKRDVNRIKRKDQNPVLKGQKTSNVAFVNVPVSASMAMEEGNANLATIDGDKSVTQVFELESVDASKKYFNEIKKGMPLKTKIDFDDWIGLTTNEIYDAMITTFPIDDFEWNDQLDSDIRYRNTYKRDVAIAIHDEVQYALNAYLAGDQEELEKRRVYNSRNSNFGEYVSMLDVAMKLVSENSLLHEIMQMKRHYFAGLDLRLKVIRSENRDSLINAAMEYQQLALAMDDKAAYVHNEIGILFNFRDEHEKALEKFEIASSIAPKWPVPYGNMSNYYYRNKDYSKSLELSQKALEFQKDFINGYVVQGLSAIQFSDYLLAEESLLKATNYNSLSYRGFDGLGDVYLAIGKYEKSDRNYEISDSIKRGLKLTGLLDITDSDGDGIPEFLDVEIDKLPDICKFDLDKFGDKDVMANFAYAYEHWRRGDLDVAEIFYKKIIEIDEQDPLVNHYLGQLHYKKENYLAATHYFELAATYYLDEENFKTHSDNLLKSQRYLDCEVDSIYAKAHYEEIDINFFLADSYRLLGHYGAAEDQYRNVLDGEIEIDPYIPYNKLWNLYIERSLFDVAATIIQEYGKINRKRANDELYWMYNNGESRYTDYKAGVLAYNRYKSGVEEEVNFTFNEDGDKIINAPEEDEDLFAVVPGIGEQLYYASGIGNPSYAALYNFRVAVEGNLTEFFDSLKVSSIFAKMGELSYANSDIDNALIYCTKALEYNSDDATPALNLIYEQLERNEFVIAYDLLSGLNERDQIDYNNLILLGQGEVLRGNYGRSDTIHQQLIDVFPLDYDGLYYFRTLRYLLSEDFDRAVEFAEVMSEGDQENDDYYYTLCRLYSKLGNKDKSQKYLRKAKKFGFDHYWVLINDPLIDSIRDTKTYTETIEEFHPFPEELNSVNR